MPEPIIELEGTDSTGDEDLKVDAFPAPEANEAAVYHYLETAEEPQYQAYLVLIVELTADDIEFCGIDRATGVASSVSHTVKFSDSHWVWRAAPSTLTDASSINNAAILFLSDNYVMGDTTPKEGLPEAKGDGGKWPRGAGTAILQEAEDLRVLLKEFGRSLDENNALKVKFEAYFRRFL